MTTFIGCINKQECPWKILKLPRLVQKDRMDTLMHFGPSGSSPMKNLAPVDPPDEQSSQFAPEQNLEGWKTPKIE